MKARFAPAIFILTSLAGFTLALGQTRGGNAENRSYIASVYGVWTRISSAGTPGQDVKFAQPVSDADCLYGEKDATVVVQREDRLVPYSCSAPYPHACPALPGEKDKNKVCSVRVGVTPTNVKQVGVVASLWNRVFKDPDKYMIAASRGLEPEFVEAVVPLAGSQLDLGATFKDMDSGDYWVLLTPLGGNGKSGRPLHLAYKRGTPAFVPSAGISATLYNVISVDQSGAPVGTEAWALVRSPDTYAAVSSQFGQLVAASGKWPEEMDPNATRAILRAYLDQLADNGGGQK